MFFIGRIIGVARQRPVIFFNNGEISIAFQFSMYPCHIDLIGPVKSNHIDDAATDNKNLLVIKLFSKRYSSVYTIYNRNTLCCPGRLPGDHNIWSSRQRLIAYGCKGFSSHYNRHGPGHILKKLHVLWQMPEQLIVLTNHVVFGSSDNKRNNHNKKYKIRNKE